MSYQFNSISSNFVVLQCRRFHSRASYFPLYADDEQWREGEYTLWNFEDFFWPLNTDFSSFITVVLILNNFLSNHFQI